MTLRTRNRSFLIFFFISFAALILMAALFAYKTMYSQIYIPQNAVRETRIFQRFPQSYFASVAAIFFLGLAVPIIILWTRYQFEKTQADETLFFMCFLFGCMMELVRICFLFMPLESSYLAMENLTRMLSIGRTIVFLSLFFSALFSAPIYRTRLEQNVLLMFLTSVCMGIIIPLKSIVQLSTFPLMAGTWLFSVAKTTLLILTLAVMLKNIFIDEFSRNILEPLGYLLMMTGYILLTRCDTWPCFISGAVLFPSGTAIYLMRLHSRVS
ncbi:MAG: hypothetical protein IKR40_03965 [Treponema sp.]|nr:hypothetical protein [Treponema sp.]